jgi:hypothetical protein
MTAEPEGNPEEKTEQEQKDKNRAEEEWKYDHFPYDAYNMNNGCFVATAVYGNINAPQVQALREIRDCILMKNYFGKEFVRFYYGGAGKKAAEVIKNNLPSVIPAIRKGLDFMVLSHQRKK